jgi:cell division septal protein FtsQ
MKPRKYQSVSPSTVLLMRQIIIGLMIAAFFSMLIISVWYGTRVHAFTINTVTVSGGETIPHSDVETVVRSKLAGSYMKIIPRTFAFTYPHEDIGQAVREVGRVKSVNVVRSGGTEIRVEFEEYVPHALWCKDNQNEGCYFLDDAGYSFTASPTLVGGSFLRFVSIGKDPADHVQAFNEDEYRTIHELARLFAEAKWFVSKAEVDAAGDAFLTIVDGGEFKVSLKQPAAETVSNLLTVLGSENFAHIKPGNFEYIDLRFGSKVFVNEVTIDNNASSTDETTDTPTQPDTVLASDPTAEPDAALMKTVEASTTQEAE